MKAWGLLGSGVFCAKLKGVQPGAEDMKSQFYGCSDQGAYIAARPGDAMAHGVADYRLTR